MTLRWRLLPFSFEVHSKPMNAVNLPGSFDSSAALIVSCHAERYAGVPGSGNPFGNWPLPKLVMMSTAACAPLPELISSYHLRPCGVASSRGSPPNQLRKETETVRVIAHDDEIERARQLHALAARSRDLLALAKTIGVPRREPAAERARVHRERRVQVRVAEERARGKVPSRVRRIRWLGGKDFLRRRLVERADVRGSRFLREGSQTETG